MHIKYHKIRRLWTPETEGILNWECIIQEKIDGANASVRIEDWNICIGSRTQILYINKETRNGFNWLVNYVLNHTGIQDYLTKNPTYRLYGEWLVQHTVRYSPEHYNHFRLYDIMIGGDEENPIFLNPVDVYEIANKYNINHPYIYWVITNPTYEELETYLNKPNLWDKQEGIVIKNQSFINKFWRPQYAKMVNESFKEENKIIFGNTSKLSPLEEGRAIRFTTPARFIKIVHKIEQEQGAKFNEKNIWEILGRCQYDIISEEIPWVVKNDIVNYGLLRKSITNVARVMALQYIEKWSEAPIFIYNKQKDKKTIA